jgi:hypothetical protein
VWVPRTLSRQATHTYSCRRPQDRSGSDPPVGKGRAGMIWAWREKLQHPMWSPTVVVGTVPGEDGPSVPFTEDHQGDRAVDVNKSTANGVSTRALQHVGSAGGPPQRDPRRWQAGPTRRRCTTSRLGRQAARALVELGLGASEGEVRVVLRFQYPPTSGDISIDQCLDTMDDVLRLMWSRLGTRRSTSHSATNHHA